MSAPVIADDIAVEVAQRFASVLFLLTCVMPNRDDAINLLHETAELPADQQAVYAARAVWPNYDELPPCSRKRLAEVSRQALNTADEVAQRLGDEAEARGAAAETAARLDAGERRLADARALLVSPAA